MYEHKCVCYPLSRTVKYNKERVFNESKQKALSLLYY